MIHLWFCTGLWFPRYYFIAMRWLILKILPLVMQVRHQVHSPHHLVPLDQSLSSSHLLLISSISFCSKWNINLSMSISLPFKIMLWSMQWQTTTFGKNKTCRFDLINNSLKVFFNISKLFSSTILARNNYLLYNACSIKCWIAFCLLGTISHGNNGYPLSLIM